MVHLDSLDVFNSGTVAERPSADEVLRGSRPLNFFLANPVTLPIRATSRCAVVVHSSRPRIVIGVEGGLEVEVGVVSLVSRVGAGSSPGGGEKGMACWEVVEAPDWLVKTGAGPSPGGGELSYAVTRSLVAMMMAKKLPRRV